MPQHVSSWSRVKATSAESIPASAFEAQVLNKAVFNLRHLIGRTRLLATG
jgi:hypothetical protein